MAQFRKKPVVIEAFTFDEFVEEGRKVAKSVVDGIPWAFDFRGHPITHGGEDLYIIPTLEGYMNFGPDAMLIVGVKGELYPCRRDIFEQTYEAV